MIARIVAVLTSGALAAASPTVAADWSTFNGNLQAQKYSTETQITPDNVKNLAKAWELHTGDVSDGSGEKPSSVWSATPLFVNDTLYLGTPFYRIFAVDPGNGDIFVSDGYGNKRVVVFDRQGRYLRQWGRQATQAETDAGVGGVFLSPVHCVLIGNDGLVYVCDRLGDRVEVFDKMGKFVRNIWIRTGTPTLPDARGTAWWVLFSRDAAQKYMYVMNGRNETIHVLDHESGKIVSTFGRPGHQPGSFTHGHTLAMDSTGSIYVAETDTGRRVQRFKPVTGK